MRKQLDTGADMGLGRRPRHLDLGGWTCVDQMSIDDELDEMAELDESDEPPADAERHR